MSDSRQKLAEFNDYFIPNLCRGEGLFGLLLMAALMSLMIALILSGLEHFDFVLLGKIALEVFWITLLSALFLCCARHYLTAPRRPSSAGSFAVFLLAAPHASAAERQS
jgi:two-component system, LytTR family, sensor histidine kinase AlgZ